MYGGPRYAHNRESCLDCIKGNIWLAADHIEKTEKKLAKIKKNMKALVEHTAQLKPDSQNLFDEFGKLNGMSIDIEKWLDECIYLCDYVARGMVGAREYTGYYPIAAANEKENQTK